MKLSDKNRILKNLIGINVTYFFMFSALNNVLSIQSVLNKDGNLGSAGQLCIFCAQLFSCLVFPQLLIDTIGFKWTLLIAQVAQMIYIGINAYPRWYTLIPGIKKTYFYSISLDFAFKNFKNY